MPSWSKPRIPGEGPDLRIERITRYLPELQRLTRHFEAGDLVVFDLDNTVFREVQMLGTDEWYSHVLHEEQRRGMSSAAVHEELGPLNRAIKHKTQMRLMEVGLPEFIRDLQKRGVYTIGLTARHPVLAQSTIRHLAEFDIDFSRQSLPEQPLRAFRIEGSGNAFLYAGGVMFSDGAKKGVTLKQMLLRVGQLPTRLAAIDDRIQHIESYVETIQDLELHAMLVHYLRVLEEPPFEPEVAQAQRLVFEKLGLVLTDDEARAFLERNPGFDVSALDWRCSKLLMPAH